MVNSDGTIGAFADSAENALTIARSQHASIAVFGFVYVIGGNTKQGVTNTIERAIIASDGTLGPFTILTGSALVNARSGHAVKVIGNRLYIFGGADGSGSALDIVESAPIAPDGSLGSFSTMNGKLNTARSGLTVEVVGDQLYVIGGIISNAPVNTVEQALIGADGVIGTFSAPSSGALKIACGFHTSFVAGGAIYVVGGDGPGPSITNEIQKGSVNPDGTLTFSLSGTQLLFARQYSASVVVNDNFYEIGGESSTALPMSRIETSSINASGVISSSIPSTSSLSEARSNFSSVVIGNNVYIVGGDGNKTIERATVGAGGVLSVFEPTSTTLTENRSQAMLAVIGKRLYVFGGADASGISMNSFEFSGINEDGSLSSFQAGAGNLIEPLFAATSTVLGNTLYLAGGESNTAQDGGTENGVTAAEIGSDGSVGPFQTPSAIQMSIARGGAAAVFVNEVYYVIGADDPEGTVDTWDGAILARDGVLGGFKNTGKLATRGGFDAAAVVGPATYLIGGGDNQTSFQSSRPEPNGLFPAFTPNADVSLSTLRNGASSVVLGDFLYVIGGNDSLTGDNSTIDTFKLGALEPFEATSRDQSSNFARPANGANAVARRALVRAEIMTRAAVVAPALE